MALDKKFLKYKLEKIKNDRIFKDQDSETKKRIRKENSKLAQEEADAIHSYLTGEDNIDIFDNKSYLENRLPGGLYLTNKGQLNIIQSQDDPKTKKSKLQSIMRKFRSIHKANLDFSKQLKIFRRIFDSLNITFNRKEIKLDGKIQTGGYQSKDGDEGITDEFQIADVDLDSDGNIIPTSYRRALLIVKNGLIVEVRRI
jgi:hypothetical protein|tara:strand:+ start:261 stop:857 length:597 start_codon:yes stop_codon:yes gene_type:complete